MLLPLLLLLLLLLLWLLLQSLASALPVARAPFPAVAVAASRALGPAFRVAPAVS